MKSKISLLYFFSFIILPFYHSSSFSIWGDTEIPTNDNNNLNHIYYQEEYDASLHRYHPPSDVNQWTQFDRDEFGPPGMPCSSTSCEHPKQDSIPFENQYFGEEKKYLSLEPIDNENVNDYGASRHWYNLPSDVNKWTQFDRDEFGPPGIPCSSTSCEHPKQDSIPFKNQYFGEAKKYLSLEPTDNKNVNETSVIPKKPETKLGNNGRSVIPEKPATKLGNNEKPVIPEKPETKLGKNGKLVIVKKPETKLGKNGKPVIPEKPETKLAATNNPYASTLEVIDIPQEQDSVFDDVFLTDLPYPSDNNTDTLLDSALPSLLPSIVVDQLEFPPLPSIVVDQLEFPPLPEIVKKEELKRQTNDGNLTPLALISVTAKMLINHDPLKEIEKKLAARNKNMNPDEGLNSLNQIEDNAFKEALRQAEHEKNILKAKELMDKQNEIEQDAINRQKHQLENAEKAGKIFAQIHSKAFNLKKPNVRKPMIKYKQGNTLDEHVKNSQANPQAKSQWNRMLDTSQDYSDFAPTSMSNFTSGDWN